MRALDKATAPKPANFICVGDLNTMGADDPIPYSKEYDVLPAEEIAHLAKWATYRNMKLVPKDAPASYRSASGAYDPTDLDHVLASEHMDIRSDAGEMVSVLGWPRLAEAEVKDWLETYSDHGCLVFEVW